MSNASQKKQRERFLLSHFVEVAQLQAAIVEETEAPDFIVRFENRRIGVELTDIFISHEVAGNSAQVQESISQRIVARARNLYEAAGMQPAHVSVGFSPGYNLRDLHRDQTAEALAIFVKRLNLSDGQAVAFGPEQLCGILPHHLSFVHALGVPSPAMAHWSVARAGWVAPLTVEALQSRIDEKALRLPEYQGAIAETWLLIVAEGRQPSQFFDMRSLLDPRRIRSPFARTYFYEHVSRIVIPLACDRVTPNTTLNTDAQGARAG